MIVGCDPAGRRVALVWPEENRSACLHLKAHPKGLRATDGWGPDARRIADWCHEVLKGVDTLWIERPIMGGSGSPLAAIRIAVTAGLVAAASTARLEFVFPVVWKAAVVGKGNADKSAVAAWLAEHHPTLAKTCGGDQDLVDAACIALYGQLAAGLDVGGARGL
jgi:Holliday junction resolvasome RuvABC endonuclease subunit